VALSEANQENSCLSVVPKSVDPGYTEGDGDMNPISNIFNNVQAFQEIRSIPCKPGGLICFSHRLMHWGSAPDPHAGAPPRVALSFAAASNDFEKPYLDRKHLPVPPLPLRVALICGQILGYGETVDPGEGATQEYFGIFQSLSSEFEPGFVEKVCGKTRWLSEKHKTRKHKTATATEDCTKDDDDDDDGEKKEIQAAQSSGVGLDLHLGLSVQQEERAAFLTAHRKAKNITLEEQRSMIEANRPLWQAEQKAKEEAKAAESDSDECDMDTGGLDDFMGNV